LRKRKLLKKSKTLLSSKSRSFSIKSPKARSHYSSEWGRRLARASCRIRPRKSWRRRTLSSCGTCWKTTCRNLTTKQRELTMISSCLCLLNCRQSADSSSQQALFWNLNVMSSAELKSCLSSTMLSGKLTCSKLGFRSRCTTLMDTGTLKKKT